MCSLAHISPPARIGLYCTDEELVMYLDKMTRGYSIPENVTADVNPFQYSPSNLPDGIWYFLRSEQKKDSEHGYWKARGEACNIYTNSDINGWRTTFDFYEGQSPQGRRSDWVIQEYRITQRGLHTKSNPKESSSLCSLFHSCGGSSTQEIKHKLGAAEVAWSSNIHPKPSAGPFSGTGSSTGQRCATESQARNRGDSTGPLAAVEELQNIPVELPDLDDCLELNDLADPESQSFSSDNSSCLTMTSEECFDSLALLQDLNDEVDRDEQAKDANFKLSVAASVRPSEVVMHAETLGSLICNNGRRSPPEARDNKFSSGRVPEIAINCSKAEKRNEGTSHNAAAAASSSSTQKADRKGGKNALGSGIKKLKRKYLCFMPF